MALFFDQDWFDQQLKSIARTHEDVAALLRLTSIQVAEIWKDQRELLPHEVSALAKLLNATPAEVADHAGVSTPVPSALENADMTPVLTRLDEMNSRLDRIERALVDLKSLVLEQSAAKSKEV
jgi:transcriptional regulator with XRE-family HTH domain